MTAVEHEHIGQLVRRFRVAAALSQEELAERSGISARAVSDLERGLRTSPRLETVRMLADGLGLDTADRATFLAAARPASLVLAPDDESGGQTRTPPVLSRLQPLPVPLTPLVGRSRLVDQVCSLLQRADGRLVTLVGPGGVGKTRLALAVAKELATRQELEVAFVDLAPVTDAKLVPPVIAAAVGLKELGERPVPETLADFLRARELLLLLDNAEHLLSFGPFLTGLLESCPKLSVLVTSREPLRLRGEHEVQVVPLPLPERWTGGAIQQQQNDSIVLFTTRARDVRPDFELTEKNVDEVAEICRRLDGLPLAIELAAARTRLLSPSALLTRLESRLGLLTGGARDAPDRHQTLRDTIAWSYDLLSSSEQVFFNRLSVFVGGCTLESAEAVAADTGSDTLEIVSSLMEKSLLQPLTNPVGEPRFRMLETIREFGREQLAKSGGETETRQRHHGYFLALTETVYQGARVGDADPNWYLNQIAKSDLELDNLRTAWRWSEQIGDQAGVLRLISNMGLFWVVRPFGREILFEVEKHLLTATDIPLETRAAAEIVASNMAAWLGDYEKGFMHANRGLVAAREIGDMGAIGSALALLGVYWEVSGECRRSAEAHREAVAAFRHVPDNFMLGITVGELGDRLLLCGDMDEGIRLIEESLEQNRKASFRFAVAVALGQLAHAARLQGDLAGAKRLFWESIVEAQEIGDERRVLGAFIGLAGVALDEGQPEHAARWIGATEAARESRGVGRVIAHPLHNARIISAIRERLGDETYERLVAEGRSIPYEQLIAEAQAAAESHARLAN